MKQKENKKNYKHILIVFSMMSVLMAYQNCTPVGEPNKSLSSDDTSIGGNNDNDPNVVTPPIVQTCDNFNASTDSGSVNIFTVNANSNSLRSKVILADNSEITSDTEYNSIPNLKFINGNSSTSGLQREVSIDISINVGNREPNSSVKTITINNLNTSGDILDLDRSNNFNAAVGGVSSGGNISFTQNPGFGCNQTPQTETITFEIRIQCQPAIPVSFDVLIENNCLDEQYVAGTTVGSAGELLGKNVKMGRSGSTNFAVASSNSSFKVFKQTTVNPVSWTQTVIVTGTNSLEKITDIQVNANSIIVSNLGAVRVYNSSSLISGSISYSDLTIPSGVTNFDKFGFKTAANNNYIVVAAYGYDKSPATGPEDDDVGAIFVYSTSNLTNSSTVVGQSSSNGTSDHKKFATAIAIDSVSNKIIVSDSQQRIYSFNASSLPTANSNTYRILDTPSNSDFISLGSQIIIRDDLLIISDPDFQDGDSGSQTGAVLLYHFNTGTWTRNSSNQTTTADFLIGPNVLGNFGNSLSLSGNNLVVGAKGAGGSKLFGSAYLYNLTNRSTFRWEFRPNPAINGQSQKAGQDFSFGNSLSILDDHVLIGQQLRDVKKGAFYINNLKTSIGRNITSVSGN